MKKVIISLASIVISISALSQTKDSFVLKSIPNYDEFGNYYEVVKSFNHIPTSKDSADFKRESRAELHIWINSGYRMNSTPALPVRKKYRKS